MSDVRRKAYGKCESFGAVEGGVKMERKTMILVLEMLREA